MIRQMKWLIVGVITACCLTGCVSTDVKELASFDLAMAIPPVGETKVFVADQVDWNAMPSCVAFAATRARTGSDLSTATMVEKIVEEHANHRPDILLVGDPKSFQSGSFSNHVGFGMFMTTPTYGKFIDATAFRLCPSMIPWRVDKDGTLIVIEDGSNLRAAGLLEGDRILSVGGNPIPKEGDSPANGYWNARLKMPVGAEVEVVWIRAGTGRMSGKIKTIANPPIHLKIPSAVFERPVRKEY